VSYNFTVGIQNGELFKVIFCLEDLIRRKETAIFRISDKI